MLLESIAFIPDGNRRYAKLNNISLAESYLRGTNKAWQVMSWMKKYPHIKTGTFYTFSLKNFSRSKSELSILMKLFSRELDKVLKSKIISKDGIRIKFIGKKEFFSKSIQKKIDKVEKYTSQFDSKLINLALGYDGQVEIVDAAKKIAQEVALGRISLNEINPESFKHYLYSEFKEPDLIVRTSKEQRLSGFLTYQSSYSELAFIDKYWPQITEQDIDTIVTEYNLRQRRFGK